MSKMIAGTSKTGKCKIPCQSETKQWEHQPAKEPTIKLMELETHENLAKNNFINTVIQVILETIVIEKRRWKNIKDKEVSWREMTTKRMKS